MPYYHFGVKQGSDNGRLSPLSGDWEDSEVLYADDYSGSVSDGFNISNLAEYEAALKENGLHHSQGVLVNQSKVRIALPAAGSDTNIMSNGIYDFILAYYNPAPDYDAAAHETRDPVYTYLVTYTDGRKYLPQWPASGLTFDGLVLPTGLTSRDIGGITANNSTERKAAADGTYAASASAAIAANGGTAAYEKGMPRVDYVGNLTVPMANYLVSNLHVTKFKNTNILGDGNQWDIYNAMTRNLPLPPIVNVGFIGNYNMTAFNGNMKGVIDITGISSNNIQQSGSHGAYLNLWTIYNNPYNIFNKFSIVHIRDKNAAINTINTINPWDTAATPADVIIYSKRYSPTDVDSEATLLRPKYRAFVNSLGLVKLTDAANSSFAEKYRGSDATKPVPVLDEAAWITAGNSGTTPDNLASNYAALSSQYKWTSASDFNTNAVVE
jgi:hypothetical protein